MSSAADTSRSRASGRSMRPARARPQAAEIPSNIMGGSRFSGLAGETVRLFVSGVTLFTVVPALILTALLGALGAYIVVKLNLGVASIYIAMLYFVSPVTTRYGLTASAGVLD